MIPSGWAQGDFGSIAKVDSGFAFKSEDFTDEEGSIPIVRMSNLKDGALDFTDKKAVPAHLMQGLDRFALKNEDFLFGMSGSLENYAIVKASNLPCYLNQRVGRLSPKESDSAFLRYIFTSQSFQKAIDTLSAGAAQKNISGKQIEGIAVLIPPLPEQKRIAEVLGSVDAAIETTRAVIEQTKKVKQGLLQTLLTQGIGHTKFKDSPLGKIPESWKAEEIGNTITIHRGFAFKSEQYTDSGVFVLRVSNINEDGKIDNSSNTRFVSEASASEYRDFYLQTDDVLLVMVGATTGKLGFVREKDLPALLNQNMWCLRTKEQCWDKGFFEFLIFREIQRFLGTQQGSARDFLTQKQFGSFLVPVPPISEQRVMAESLQATSLLLDSEKDKLNTLQQLKKGLMHDLLTGKVRVA